MVESGTYPARSERRGHFRLHDHVECEQVARELAEDLIYVARASGAFALLRNTRMNRLEKGQRKGTTKDPLSATH